MSTFINPHRLKLARTRRKQTYKSLSEVVGISTKTLSAYEKEGCKQEPKEEKLRSLSKALDYPISFFTDTKELESLSPDAVSFRSLKSMSAKDEHAAISAGQIGITLNEYFNETLTNLPKANLPNLRGIAPEAAAETIREEWGLGIKSIANIVHILEMYGVRVFSLAENTQAVDAFSFWKKDVPYIFLNTQKSGERSRFDAAHELGHLLLHKHGTPQGKDIEAEADTFAANLLMPKKTLLPYKNINLQVSDIIELKEKWKVSAMALIVQMKNTKILSEWHYRNLIVDASKLGLRTTEINGIPHERSGLIPVIIEKLEKEKNINLTKIAVDLNLPIEEITNLIFRLGLVSGGASPSSQRISKPTLTIVK